MLKQRTALPLQPWVLGALIVLSTGLLAPTTPAQAATVAGSGIFDNSASAVTLSGGWTAVRSTHATAGTYANLAANGYASLTFSGSGVTWTARTNASGGIADVYLDGTKKQSVSLYSASTRFQKVVFSATGLRTGQHTLRIVRTGTKVAASTGRNVMLDALQVLDSRPPTTPTTVTARAERTGARVTWAASTSRDVAGYRVYRTPAAGGLRTLVGTTTAATRTLLDIGLAERTAYSFRVTAVDSSGNGSAPSVAASAAIPRAAAPTTRRYANCPTATTTVSNRAELAAALTAAGPGTVIRLNPGHYGGEFVVGTRATAAAPLWICGPRTAVIDGGDPTRRGGFKISSSAHVILAGMTVRNSIKGISVWHSTAVTVADTRVEHIGDEAIHLLDFTTDTTVVANSIDGTGLVDPEYGEGVYIGTADRNWCAYSQCLPDRSDRNTIVGNDIRHTTAEPIEAKVATSGGLISQNTINGTGMRRTSYALIYVKGNGYVVAHNTGSNSSIDGILVTQRNAGWGRDNLVFGNHFSGSIPGYGVRLDAADLGNIVGCGGTTGSNSIAATSKLCQP